MLLAVYDSGWYNYGDITFFLSYWVYIHVCVYVCVCVCVCTHTHPLGKPSNSSGKEPTCQCRRYKGHRFDPWATRSPGGGNDNLLQYSSLENPMDRGAWRATVRGVTKSQTRLRD